MFPTTIRRVILIPDLDGVRLLSVTKHEFLQRVPLPIEDVFKIGSLRAGSMLYEAYKVWLTIAHKFLFSNVSLSGRKVDAT